MVVVTSAEVFGAHPDNEVPLADHAPLRAVSDDGFVGELLAVEAFVEERAAQCGYCINGMVMQSIVFLRKNPRPTEAQIKRSLNANICRCGTHYRILKAVQRAARTTA